jgi:hypothetical protein
MALAKLDSSARSAVLGLCGSLRHVGEEALAQFRIGGAVERL